MSFEDTIRVAALKTRSDRAERIRAELRTRKDQVVTVNEFMKPRVEEICGTLPARSGRGCSPRRPGVVVSGASRATARSPRLRSAALRCCVRSPGSSAGGAARCAIRKRTHAFATGCRALPLCRARLRARGRSGGQPAPGQGLRRHARARLAGLHATAGGRRAARRPRRLGRTMQQLREAALADEHGRALDRALAELDRAVA